MLLAILVACATQPSDTGPDLPQPAPLAEPTGTCPDLSAPGEVTWTSNGRERRAQVFFPDEPPADLPVLVMFHGMGDTDGRSLVQYLRLKALADEAQAVIVVPSAVEENWLEWGFMNGGDDDLALYDDLRACLSESLAVDLRRYTAAGFSAGALFTSFLVLLRSDTLSAAVTFSGGTDPIIPYETPESKTPVLLAWGGEADEWGAGAFLVEFDTTTLAFAGQLLEDGHVVVGCDHGLGHTVPSWGRDALTDWAFDHAYGEPSPWADGPADLPADCVAGADL